tara:strand:+ start:3252 stop:3689 length:438 start_codon:yes stop_codon:yes gene_type:complete
MIGITSGIRMIAIGGLLSVAAGGYWYYTSSQAKINSLQTTVAQSSAAIAVQKQFINKQSEAIVNLNDNIVLLQEVQNKLTDQARESAAEVVALKSKFNTSSSGKDRDLGELAAKKPGLISNIVNKATAALGVMIEDLTAKEEPNE